MGAIQWTCSYDVQAKTTKGSQKLDQLIMETMEGWRNLLKKPIGRRTAPTIIEGRRASGGADASP